MNSSLEAKTENSDSKNVSIIKEQAVVGKTCGSDIPSKEMEKSNKITSDNSCKKIANGINEADNGGAKCSGESGDVMMAEGVKNGDAKTNQQMNKTSDSPEDANDSPGSKSELVVLDEVDESLDGKGNNDDITSSKGGHDAKISSDDTGDNSNTSDNQKKNADDPYAYVKREDFTSEKYKIEIRGLPKFYGYGELKKFLNDKLKLSSHKMKPTRNRSPGVFVCFKNEEDRQAALKTLNRLPWKGRTLTAMTARPAPDPLVKKRKLENEAALNYPGKKPRVSDDEKLRNSTTPYWNLSYDEQLKRKHEYVTKIMVKLADHIVNVNPMLIPWIKRQKTKYKGMACNLLDIRKSPTCDGYRNKCEFTIGINEETKQRMVGFRLGSYVQGHVGVGPIDSLKHIPQRMKEAVKVFEKFVKESDREPFNPETHTGHWRQLTLRLTTLDEFMAVVLVNSKGTSADELALAKQEIKAFFENGEGKDLKVNSLYFQAFGNREAGKEPPRMEHLLGSKYITESIHGLKFRISPEAFFQVNTPGAGVLYSTVGEIIDLNPTTTIVDVCCGTGTIGLSLAKDCGQVLGLELVPAAIEDAKVNAVENNITNSEFFTGRAEEILTSVLSRAKGKSVYAIVDPPRSGLQQKAVISLRGAEVIDKIIYVSCDPNAALKNFVDLARITSKAYHGYPLVPITAIPVDMFPHTAHCEVVVLFHRINPINLPKTIPGKEDDIAILSATLAKSPEKSLQPPDAEKKENSAKENSAKENSVTETSPTETNNDNKNSESVSCNDQKESIVSSEQQTEDKQMTRRKRPGRNQRLRARSLIGGDSNRGKGFPPSMPGSKVSTMEVGSGSTATNKPGTMVEAKNKISTTGKMGKLIPRLAFKRDKAGNKVHFVHNIKPYDRPLMKERNLIPKLGDPGVKRRWRKDGDPPMRGSGIFRDEGLWLLSQDERGDLVMEDLRQRESYPRRGDWKNQESQRRDIRSRSPPQNISRHGTARRSGGVVPDENLWLRREQCAQDWMEERERPCEGPARKLLRRDDQPLVLEAGAQDGGRYSVMAPNYREVWSSHDDDNRPLEHEPRLNGKGFHDRAEEDRFGRMRSERSPIRDPDAAWGKRRRRETSGPVRVYEGDEFRGRMDSEGWGHGSGEERCENVGEGLNFRRKYIDEVEGGGRPNTSDLGERHSRRSCERFNRRSPEMLKRRSSDRFDRRFCERFERRSIERFERRPSASFDKSSYERFDRSPCGRCDRRSNERVCRPQEDIFVNDVYRESRQELVRPEGDFIGSRPNILLQERETVAQKYPQQMEPALHRQERYNEPESRLSVNYRENRNNVSTNKVEYLSSPSSPIERVGGITGSVDLNRKSEVYVYRAPNDASMPLPLNLEGRIPVSQSSTDNRAIHYEKRYESNILPRNYDVEKPGGQNDHNVIARRVEVIRRPFIADNKFGMVIDSSGKSSGTAEVLVVTAKNQMFDEDHRSQLKPNENVSSIRVLDNREMNVMRKPWIADESPSTAHVKSTSPTNKYDNRPEIHSGRSADSGLQGNWTYDRGLKEMPKPWGEVGSSNPVRSQPIISDANISKFMFRRQDLDERQNIPTVDKISGAAPNARLNMEKPFSLPTSQTGYAPNSQAPPNVASHLDISNKIPEQPNWSQNAPFNFMSQMNRMPTPYQSMNNMLARPPVFTQNPPAFIGSRIQGTPQMPMLPSKQPLPMQCLISDISNQQRMPSATNPAPDSKMNSWNFKGINPWSENNQQMMLPQKHW